VFKLTLKPMYVRQHFQERLFTFSFPSLPQTNKRFHRGINTKEARARLLFKSTKPLQSYGLDKQAAPMTQC
jgi:hypothetical protein